MQEEAHARMGMKVWLVLTLFTILRGTNTAAHMHSQCPTPDWFDVVISIAVDETAPTGLNADPELHFIKEDLKLTDKEIEYVLQDAIYFLNRRFGLDFPHRSQTS